MRSRARTLALRTAGLVLSAVILSALLPGVAMAQAVTGTILGTVADSTGAVVAGAKVTVTNQGTGLSRAVPNWRASRPRRSRTWTSAWTSGSGST